MAEPDFVQVPLAPTVQAPVIRVEMQRVNAASNSNGHPGRRGLWCVAARLARMIRIGALWLSVAPLDMRAGMDTLLTQVVRVFGQAQPDHAYLFSNRRGTRLKVLVHNGFGVWLACRRLNQGRFHWTEGQGGVARTRTRFDALVLGLPWQRQGDGGVIRTL